MRTGFGHLQQRLLRSSDSGSDPRGRRWVIQHGQMLITAQSGSRETFREQPLQKESTHGQLRPAMATFGTAGSEQP